MFELINKVCSVTGFDYQLVHSASRESNLKIYLPCSKTNIRKYFPLLLAKMISFLLQPSVGFLLNAAHDSRA